MMSAELLRRSAQADSDAPALVVADRPTRYGELAELAARWHGRLAAAGVRPGDRLVLRMESRPDLIAALFAVWALRAVGVPLDESKPPAEIGRAIEAAGARFVVGSAELLSRLPATAAAPLVDDRPPPVAYDVSTGGLPEDDDRPALFVFTSGTTGSAGKCVSFSARALAANVRAMVEVMGWTRADRCVTPVVAELPAVLVGAVLPALAVGASVCWPPVNSPRALVTQCTRQQATILVAVPYVYGLLCRSPDAEPLAAAPLRWCVATSAPTRHEWVAEFHRRTGQLIRPMYCSSEAGSCTLNTGDTVEECASSVGRPLPGVRIRVLTPSGEPASPGRPGNIVVAGPLIASGYVGQPDLDREVFLSDGVHTGDLGHLDDQGRLHLMGRLSELINCGGHTVDPDEVRRVLEQHPSVREALVYGEPDDHRGTRVVAAVVLHESTTRGVLAAHCRHHIAAYKVPQRFDFVPDLPHRLLGSRGG